MSYSIGGKDGKVFKKGETVNEANFIPNVIPKLLSNGFIMKKTGTIKIGVLIPTRGDRKKFLNQAKKLLLNQTVKPNYIEIVDDAPVNNDVDITYRYRIGCERLFSKGCEIVLFWEDDDWYAPEYIETMVDEWKRARMPEIFGIGYSTYYHILGNKYMTIAHKGRASAMSTLVTKKVLSINWGADNYAYTDIVLWKELKGSTFHPQKPINLGIKHGMGLCGGGGHTLDFQHYNKTDFEKEYLKNIVGSDFDFYKNFNYNDVMYKYDKIKLSEDPFLSIVTRVYKRPVGIRKNKESIDALSDKSLEQIFIHDEVGFGMFEANKSFSNVKNMIDGKYVLLLDDDDFIVNKNMIEDLKKIAKEKNPDVIFFRMTIKNGMNNNHYPTEHCWNNKPLIAHIGGTCFVVKKEIYNEFIHNFAHERCGDFHFINSVFNSGASVFWLDKLMCETGKVSRGAKE